MITGKSLVWLLLLASMSWMMISSVFHDCRLVDRVYQEGACFGL